MILFKPEHAKLILAGQKTQTRRIWKRPRAKVGLIHLAKTKMISKEFFAKIRILDVHLEELGSISEEDAKAEGYPSIGAYLNAFREINHIRYLGDLAVYVVRFEVVADA
jgi:hypothetical protein